MEPKNIKPSRLCDDFQEPPEPVALRCGDDARGNLHHEARAHLVFPRSACAKGISFGWLSSEERQQDPLADGCQTNSPSFGPVRPSMRRARRMDRPPRAVLRHRRNGRGRRYRQAACLWRTSAGGRHPGLSGLQALNIIAHSPSPASRMREGPISRSRNYYRRGP